MVTTLLIPTLLWGIRNLVDRVKTHVDNLTPTYLKFARLVTNLPTWTRTD